MTKFLSKDRKRILLSSLLGPILIIIGAFLAGADSAFVFMPGVILVVFSYTFFQYLIFSDRKITLNEKQYLNADNEDVTNRMPRDWMVFILAILWVAISWFTISSFHSFIVSLRTENDFDNILSQIDEGFALIAPYIIIQTYFFIKNLPVIAFAAFPNTGSYNNFNYSCYDSAYKPFNYHSSSSMNDSTDPSKSYLCYNVFHKR